MFFKSTEQEKLLIMRIKLKLKPMMEAGIKILCMEQEPINGQMDVGTKGNILEGKRMGKVDTIFKMEIILRANGKTEKKRANLLSMMQIPKRKSIEISIKEISHCLPTPNKADNKQP